MKLNKSKLGLPWGTHKQAIDVCNQIFTGMAQGEKRFIVLMSMQSGKTSVIQILSERLGAEGPHRIVYLCSYDRVSYRQQITNDLRVFEPEECLVLVGKDILKYEPQVNDIVIIDEAGYGVSENQRLDRALRAVDAAVVAVSATPYEALKSQWKGCVVSPDLESLTGYYGIWDMIEHGVVGQAQEILVSKGKRLSITSWFQDILDNMPAHSYGIVRVRNRDEAERLQRQLAKQNVRSDIWAQGSVLPAPIQVMLDTMPRRKKVFIVVNHLRMGERIKDTYLDFVVERLPRMRSVNNTIAQSLIGRCCGWDKTPGKVRIYTDVAEAEAYVRMWDDIWKDKEISMLKRGNATKNFLGAYRVQQAVDATVEVVRGFDNLPSEVKAHLKKGVLRSRNGRHKDEYSYVANNPRGEKWVESKSYFGQGRLSERNRTELVMALRAIQANQGKVTNFNQFADRHKQGALSKYGVFCIRTDELYEEFDVRDGDFVLMTRQGGRYMLESNTVQLKKCLFTTLAGDSPDGDNKQGAVFQTTG